MKTCNKCGKEKELSKFGNAKKNIDGHKGACKACEYNSRSSSGRVFDNNATLDPALLLGIAKQA